MKKYVLIYACPIGIPENSILAIRKNRPEWCKGKVNLPGGKIEKDESIIDCAVRELKEETGLEPLIGMPIKIIGEIKGNWGIVYCVKIPVFYSELKPRDGETEEAFWSDFPSLLKEKLLIPNLKSIIPMMISGVEDWEIMDNGVNFNKSHHSFSIKVPTK